MIIDLFAGPGGWDLGLKQLGITDCVGFELNPTVCATRAATGHLTIRTDVSLWPIKQTKTEGLIASPPCPDWSNAGIKKGRSGQTGWLIDEPLRWVKELMPTWIAFEQVQTAIHVWEQYCLDLQTLGYHTWCGILCAANYGLPQVRRRAILMASLDKEIGPPPITHPKKSWVTMASALSWSTVPSNRWINGQALDPNWPLKRPSLTVADYRMPQPGGKRNKTYPNNPGRTQGAIRLTQAEAAILQGFPSSYPWCGNKTQRHQQIGDAIPPPLAKAILKELI